MQQTKARIGENKTFIWRSPRPVTAAPSLSAVMPTGTVHVVGAMTPVLAAQTITAIDSADRAKLTASGAIAAGQGLQGEYGDAWLLTAGRGPMAVRVVEINGSTVRLAEPLPSLPPLTSNAQLVFATWTATLSSGTVTAARALNIILRIAYTTNEGSDAPAQNSQDEIALDVVRNPWALGTTPADVLEVVPRLRSTLDPADPSMVGAIRLTGRRLESQIGSDLAERYPTNTLDDVLGPARGRFELVHAHLAAAELLQDDEGAADRLLDIVYGPEDANGDRKGGLYDQALRLVLFDTDRDGVPDEEPQQVSGPRSSAVGGSFVKRSDPPFKRGAYH